MNLQFHSVPGLKCYYFGKRHFDCDFTNALPVNGLGSGPLALAFRDGGDSTSVHGSRRSGLGAEDGRGAGGAWGLATGSAAQPECKGSSWQEHQEYGTDRAGTANGSGGRRLTVTLTEATPVSGLGTSPLALDRNQMEVTVTVTSQRRRPLTGWDQVH